MTFDQIFLFALLGAIFVMLIWGRVRYDLVAFAGLVVAVFAGVVPVSDAFSGFGNQAVVIVALVLIVSRALQSAGAVEIIARYVVSPDRALPAHIGIMATVGAAMSAVMNNVAALAMLMNLDMDAARKAKRAVALSLMPLSFATILGGMITLIGTPPNIVIAEIRARAVGEPFGMFDYTPVGLVCAVAGIAFVALFGWRLIPASSGVQVAETAETEHFVVEAKVPEDSKAIDQTPRDLYELADKSDVTILGLVRRGRRLTGFASAEIIRKSDLLVLEGNSKAIEAFIGAAGLAAPGQDKHGGLTGQSMTLVEAVVPKEARLSGRSAYDLRLLNRRGVSLIGVSRQGKRFRDRVQHLKIRPGDLVLLLGPEPRVAQVTEWLGIWPLEQGRHSVLQRQKALMTIGVFAAAIATAVAGLAPLPITLAAAVILYALFNIVSARGIYESIDWPVIVLLASLIPIGTALETSGGTQIIANAMLSASSSLPPWAILTLIMVVTMTLSDFLNNVATALIAGPVAVSVAQSLGVSPDPFLMAVAVAASCAFLTPIGHQNNTIIMGPGGYRFGDYWRMGLPLEVLVIAVAIPSILFFWPL
jgi:di/tricarboxylate transporter